MAETSDKTVIEYKCPCCNAGLKYDSKTGEMVCEYCDNKFSVEQLEQLILLGGQVDIALDHGCIYSHDISRGGVFAALWEMGDALKCGLEVCHDNIPILQETIEICEHTGDNPYMIDGCGAALFVVPDGDHLTDKLYEAGYEASVIGHLTEKSDRVVVHDDERRFLTPPRFL